MVAGRIPFDRSRRRALRASLALALAPVAMASLAQSRERTIAIVAKKFDFVPAVVHAKRGETLVLQLSAPEVPMGFSLPDFQARADVVPGRTSTLRVTPDRAGTFTFVCDVFCGSGHEDMSGTLVVA